MTLFPDTRPPREVGMSFDPSSLMGMQAGIKDMTRRKPDAAKRVRPGDTIWVKEGYKLEDVGYKGVSLLYRSDNSIRHVDYAAMPKGEDTAFNFDGKNRGGMYMPKWASRYRLVVLDVRVERLQDISEEDCGREGIFYDYVYEWGWHGSESKPPKFHIHQYNSPREAYRARWDGLNKAAPWRWEDNPEVAVITFGPLIHV